MWDVWIYFSKSKASDINASLINVADAKDITPDPQIDAQTKRQMTTS